MKLSDYVADFIADLSPRVYAVCGAGAMHLNDSICHHERIKVIAMHHEQAATFAAEADARVANKISVVHVTAGPGGTNTLTGVACAYVDSIPMLIIAGQVTSNTMAKAPGLRQLGMNELDTVAMAQPVTKFAITVTEPFMIRYYLERAVHCATTGRPGPAWLEIPLDVQAADVDPEHMVGFTPKEWPEIDHKSYLDRCAQDCYAMLARARKPVMIIGNGVRLSGACDMLDILVNRLQIPVISSWNASDIIDNDSPYYLGRCGLFGDRASNMAVQSADLILAIGTRLSVAQTGHAVEKFAPNAKRIVVDIDGEETQRPGAKVDLAIIADVREFLSIFRPGTSQDDSWRSWCRELRLRYGFESKVEQRGNAYDFVRRLEGLFSADDAIIVTDVGFSFIPVMQAMKLKPGQRLFHSSGVSPMGWAIPAAIGACQAAHGRQVVCIVGDGGAMMNLQELQTIARLNLPITIFVMENNGYATMRIAQNNHFGRESIAGVQSGVTCADISLVADAVGIRSWDMWPDSAKFVGPNRPITLNAPELVNVHLDPDQIIAPRVQAKTQNGKFIPTDISDMWPYLVQAERATA